MPPDMLADYRLESPGGPRYTLEYVDTFPNKRIRLLSYDGYRELFSLVGKQVLDPAGNPVDIHRHGGEEIRFYHAQWGRRIHSPVYLGERQVAQVVTDPEIIDCLPQYDLYLLPKYDELAPLLILHLLRRARTDGMPQDSDMKSHRRVLSAYAIPHARRLRRYDPGWLEAHFPGNSREPIRYPRWIGFAARFLTPLVGCLFCLLPLVPAYAVLRVHAPSGRWLALLVPLYGALVYRMVIRPALR